MKKERIGKWISSVYRQQQRFLTAHLEPVGLTGSLVAMYMTVRFSEGISQQELADHLRIDKTTTAKAVRQLIDRGYIQRCRSNTDKRCYCLSLTKKGKAIIPTIDKVLNELDTVFSQALSPKQMKTLEGMLDKLELSLYEHIEGNS